MNECPAHAEAAVATMEELRRNLAWHPILVRAAGEGAEDGWCGGQRGPPQRLRQWLKALSRTRHLSPATIAQVEICFSAEKVSLAGWTQSHASLIALCRTLSIALCRTLSIALIACRTALKDGVQSLPAHMQAQLLGLPAFAHDARYIAAAVI